MSVILRVENLRKAFAKVEALKDVSFQVEKGQVVGFLGPNGAGKTTCMRILIGAIKRDFGLAQVFGLDVWKDSYEIHKKISYLPGDISLWPSLRGQEVIDLFMKLHGHGNEAKRDRLIEKFDLDPSKKIRTYSKGNKQKVSLIAALAIEADLYIFDEPTTGLDPLMDLAFQDEVNTLKEEGKSLLLSSHILSEVDKIADKVVIIRQGEVVEEGLLKDLRHLSRVKISLETDDDISKIEKLDGVFNLSKEDGRLVFMLEKDKINDFLKEASKLNIRDMRSQAESLEDLFIRHY